VVLLPGRLQLLVVIGLVGVAVLAAVGLARDPRRQAIRIVSVVLMASTFSGVPLAAGISLQDAVPAICLMLTLPAGVVAPPAARLERVWALLLPFVMVVGGVIAATRGDGNIRPILTFAVTGAGAFLVMHRLRPTAPECLTLVTGLVGGVLVSVVLGIGWLREPDGRAQGLTDHPNQFAMAAVACIPLVVLLGRAGRVRVVVSAMTLVVLVVGLFESGSRSGLIALAIVTVLIVFRAGGAAAITLFLLAAIAAGLSSWLLAQLGALPTFDRLLNSSTTESSDAGRVTYMSETLADIRQGNFLLGPGLDEAHLPHNVALLIWAGMGLAGLLAFALILVLVLPAGLQRRSSLYEAALSQSVWGYLATLALNNALGASFLWLVMGMQIFGRARASSPTTGAPLARALPVGAVSGVDGVGPQTTTTRSGNEPG
jgi:hypothetical protein